MIRAKFTVLTAADVQPEVGFMRLPDGAHMNRIGTYLMRQNGNFYRNGWKFTCTCGWSTKTHRISNKLATEHANTHVSE